MKKSKIIVTMLCPFFLAIPSLVSAVPFTYEEVASAKPSVGNYATFADYSINDHGDVSYTTVMSDINSSGLITTRNSAVRIQNGVSTKLHSNIYGEPGLRLSGSDLHITMNNHGDTGFFLSPENSGEHVMYESLSGQFEINPVFVQSGANPPIDMNDNRDYVRPIAQVGRGTPVPMGLPSGTKDLKSPNINNNNMLAITSYDSGLDDSYIDVFAWDGSNGVTQTTLVLEDTVYGGGGGTLNPYIGFNDAGAVAFSQQTSSGHIISFATPFDDPNTYSVIGDGNYSVNSSNIGLNNLNSILFSGDDASSRSLNLVSSDGSNRREVVNLDDLSQFDKVGLRATGINNVGGSGELDDERLNNKDEVLFMVSYEDGSSALFKAIPKQGTSPGVPILPAPGSEDPNGGWSIPVSQCIGRCFIDPEYAVGYEYSLSVTDAFFESVYIPTPLSGGDGTFSISFNGMNALLEAGQTFNFTDYFMDGVADFIIDGIDIDELLDPLDSSAFVTGLTFIGRDNMDFSVNMKAITQFVDDGTSVSVSEPSALALLSLGLVGLMLRRNGRL